MKSYRYLKSAFAILVCTFVLTTSNICVEKVTAQDAVVEAAKVSTATTETVTAMNIVNSPKEYLNKSVVIKAKFDKFSTLGLDYKPAFKSSEDYISFLIKREDTVYDIPLSEMKIFIKRQEAEKFIDLKTNDEIQIEGTVFSDALGDAWLDVSKLTLIKKAVNDNGVK